MSTLKVNAIEPTSGNVVVVNSELLIKSPSGDITLGGTGSSNLSASYAATAGCASSINISSIVPGDTTTSIVLVNDQAVGCQSTFIDTGLTYNASTNVLSTTVTTAQTASYINAINIVGTVANATTASYATTSECASNINISSTTSGDTATSIVLVNNQAVGCQSTFVDSKLMYDASNNTLSTDNLDIATSITSSGDIKFPFSGNAVVRPIINLVPNGTASYNPSSTNTTAYSNYGINLITTATSQSYCLRLPQTPTKGKTVTIINNSGINVTVFPSMVGGDINGMINGYTIIPSDGKSYSFDCYENPLPGGWSLGAAPVTGNTIINSGVVNWNFTGAGITGSNYFAFINDSIKVSGSVIGTSNLWDALSYTWQYQAFTYLAYFNGISKVTNCQILPDTIPNNQVWKSIDSIQLSTNIRANLSQSFYTDFPIGYSNEFYYNPSNPVYDAVNNYKPSTPYPSWYNNSAYTAFSSSVMNPWYNSHPGTATGQAAGTFTGFSQVSFLSTPGTFVSSSLSSHTSDNVGDPGTLIIQHSIPSAFINSYNPGPKMIGRNYIGTFLHPTDGLCDRWYSAAIGINLNTYLSTPIPNIKLQAFYNIQI
jgi:hypothetical protein